MSTRWWLVLFVGWTLLLVEAAPYLVRPSIDRAIVLRQPDLSLAPNSKSTPPLKITYHEKSPVIDWISLSKLNAARLEMSLGENTIDWPCNYEDVSVSEPFVCADPKFSGRTEIAYILTSGSVTVAIPVGLGPE